MPISSGIILLQHLFIIAAAHTIRYKSHYIFARSAGAIMIVSVQIKASVPATCLEEIAGPTYTIWDITRPLHFCPIHTNRHILQTCMCVIKILKKKEKNLQFSSVPIGDRRRTEKQTTTTTTKLNFKLPIAFLSFFL